VVTVSYLMISPFPYPKSTRVLHLPPLFWAGMGLVMATCWAIAGWQAVPFSIFLLYALSGPALALYNSTRRRLRQV